jgi:hypothetical protein
MSLAEGDTASGMAQADDISTLAERVRLLKRDAEALLAVGAAGQVSQATVQQLLVMGLKLYIRQLESGPSYAPFEEGEVTATEVAVATTRMLRVVNLEVFELGLWNSWGSL